MLILLADDHAVVRRGLRDILASAFPRHTSSRLAPGTRFSAPFAMAIATCWYWTSICRDELEWTCCGRSNICVPAPPVLMLSVQPEDQYAVRCLKAGASGYLNKDSAEEELVRAVRKVLSGGRYVSGRLSEKLANDLQQPPMKDPHELLSDRELDVIRMIAAGTSLTDIAEVLHVSVKTVSTYRCRSLLRCRCEVTRTLCDTRWTISLSPASRHGCVRIFLHP